MASCSAKGRLKWGHRSGCGLQSTRRDKINEFRARNCGRNYFESKGQLAMVVIAIFTTVGLVLLGMFTQHNNGSASSIAWLFLAISAHTKILKGRSGPLTMYKKGVFGPFLWRSAVFAILALLLLIPAAHFAEFGKGHESWVGGLAILMYFFVQTLLLSMWGTWLPAVVADGDRSLAAANRRGRKVFSFVFSRLIGLSAALWISAALITFVLTFIAVLIKHLITIEIGFDLEAVPVWSVILVAVACQTVLVATILSRAYLIAEGKMKDAPPATSAS